MSIAKSIVQTIAQTITQSFIISFLLLAGCHGRDHETAFKNLKEYLKDLEIISLAKKCNKYDTDGDGYVSCEYKNENEEIVYLECWGNSWYDSDGCRSPQPKIHIHNTHINSSSNSSSRSK